MRRGDGKDDASIRRAIHGELVRRRSPTRVACRRETRRRSSFPRESVKAAKFDYVAMC